MYQRRIYLYAFNKDHVVVRTQYLKGDHISISNISTLANDMHRNDPEHPEVYAIENRPGLKEDFWDAVKVQSWDFAKRYEFYDEIVREGHRIV